MNSKIMKLLGFDNCIKNIEKRCCSWCGKSVNLGTEFRDDVSKLEYAISGLCQSCQDKIYGL